MHVAIIHILFIHTYVRKQDIHIYTYIILCTCTYIPNTLGMGNIMYIVCTYMYIMYMYIMYMYIMYMYIMYMYCTCTCIRIYYTCTPHYLYTFHYANTAEGIN